jgi:tetratricopeptide (TPR) repeat protein
MNTNRNVTALLMAVVFMGALLASSVRAADAAKNIDEVLVYSSMDDGSIMHWLSISPLRYDVAFLGDSMSADVLEGDGKNELTIRPRAGDMVQKRMWQKMHFNGAITGPSLCDLFNVSGGSFEYGITCSYVYLYSPVDRTNAIIAASADDGLKIVFNGLKIWSNQIQRSPTYDSDKAPAPLKKGWNTLLMVVDQVWGGHLLCARFLDGDKPVTDIEISLDPPTENAKRHEAAPYNKEAGDLMHIASGLNADGKLNDTITACDQVLTKCPLADVAPRAAYTKAAAYYSLKGEKSLGQADKSVEALDFLLVHYPQDILAEYALLDIATLQETALKDTAKAEATYRSFEDRYPQSSLAAKSVVELARMLAEEKKFEDAILTYRKAIKKYPQADEVMTATVGIADTYRLSGEKDKAGQQYETAMAMAKDWRDNKYGVDVGKQAWLSDIMDDVRMRLSASGK